MPEKTLPFLTKMAKATTKSGSIRTTTPKEVAKFYNLDAHDALAWRADEATKDLIIKKWEGEQNI